MKLTEQKLKNIIMEVLSEIAAGTDEARLNRFMSQISSESGDASMVIVTAENPPAKVQDPHSNNPKVRAQFDKVIEQVNDTMLKDWDNAAKMKELEADLNSLNLEYMMVEGEYFGPETSFLVFNMTKEDGIRLGKKYLQDAIVYGRKMRATNMDAFNNGTPDDDYIGRDPESQAKPPESGAPKIYFEFEMIGLEPNHFTGEGYNERPSDIYNYHIQDSRNMIIAGANTQTRTQLFSKVGNRKFVIPFFSDDAQHAPMDDLYNVRPV
jgi:hypothetical protein